MTSNNRQLNGHERSFLHQFFYEEKGLVFANQETKNSIFMKAVSKRSTAFIKYLVSHVDDECKIKALKLAREKGYQEIVEILKGHVNTFSELPNELKCRILLKEAQVPIGKAQLVNKKCRDAVTGEYGLSKNTIEDWCLILNDKFEFQDKKLAKKALLGLLSTYDINILNEFFEFISGETISIIICTKTEYTICHEKKLGICFYNKTMNNDGGFHCVLLVLILCRHRLFEQNFVGIILKLLIYNFINSVARNNCASFCIKNTRLHNIS